MADLYRSEASRAEVQRWCAERLAGWHVAHECRLVDSDAGPTHVLEAGAGRVAVVYLPGTNFNAATSLDLLGLLAAHCRVFAVDLPGQPGLSTPHRPPATPGDQRRWLAQLVRELALPDDADVVLVGHSRGAHVALCADPRGVDGLVLVNPAGLTKVAAGPAVLRTAIPWVLRANPARSRALLRLMSGPGNEPDPVLVEWLTMVGTLCRTSGAPGPLPPGSTEHWRSGPVTVLTGEHDCFFPAGRIVPTTRARLGTDAQVIAGVGHLSTHEAPTRVVECIREALASGS